MCTKKEKNYKGLLILFLLLLASAAAYFSYKWWRLQHAKSTKYPAFGISIPGNYFIHGIDVSKYQQVIAWDEVKAMRVKNIQLGFAFIKATEGIGNTDKQFHRNWKRSKKAGIIRGAYHYFLATKDGKAQAENFIRNVELQKNDLPPVLDVELTYGVSTQIVKKEVRKWLETVEQHYGVKPIIYTNVDFYKQRLGGDFDEYRLWIAHYYQPGRPRIQRDWLFWQHSEEGRVNGILSKVDFNIFNGDSTDFKALLIN